MPEISTISYPSIKNVISIWWKFFWRYALLFVVMLFINGVIINQVGKFIDSPSLIFWGSIGGNYLVNILVSLFIFHCILGKQLGKSEYILVPSSKKENSTKLSSFQVLLTWWSYFWRFSLFAFALAFTIGALLPHIGESLGYNPFTAAKYSKYVGNISVIPASLCVFLILMWRTKKRRKLELIPVK